MLTSGEPAPGSSTLAESLPHLDDSPLSPVKPALGDEASSEEAFMVVWSAVMASLLRRHAASHRLHPWTLTRPRQREVELTAPSRVCKCHPTLGSLPLSLYTMCPTSLRFRAAGLRLLVSRRAQ